MRGLKQRSSKHVFGRLLFCSSGKGFERSCGAPVQQDRSQDQGREKSWIDGFKICSWLTIPYRAQYDRLKINMEATPSSHPEKKVEKRDNYRDYTMKIFDILKDLSERHSYAYAAAGGQEGFWHLDENQLTGSDEETSHMQEILATMEQIRSIADNTSLTPDDRKAQMERAGERYHQLVQY